MGVSHAEVGAYLLGLWGLPAPVVEAVANHHMPRRIPHTTLDNVGTVHIANVMANENPVYPPIMEPLPKQMLDADYLNAVGIINQVAQFEEMAKTSANALRAPAAVARSSTPAKSSRNSG